ncbi:MAG: DinB family protein [Gemmatimonadaceae bacterium]
MTLHEQFIALSRQYLAYEYPRKIELCLRELPADALWKRPADGSNSIGNLLLHLSGNIRQWIVSSVGGAPDHRVRSAEFAAAEGGDAATLFAGLRKTLDEADAVIARLSAADLESRRTVQGREVSVFDAVYHVVEHFSLHTGQIILLTKLHAPGAIRFYEDAGGLATPVWRDA